MTENQQAPTPGETDPGPWTIEKGITCVVCPQCAFTFAEEHEDEQIGEAGWYTCPVCDETGRLPDLGDDSDEWDLTTLLEEAEADVAAGRVYDLDARPPDSMIAAYIEDLEQALADARAEVRTRAEYIERVRPWAQQALEVVAPELGVSLIVTHDPVVREVADHLTGEDGSDG